jgi:hypothetical protein
MFGKCGHQGMGLSVFDESLQSQHVSSVGLGSKGEAATDGLTVQQHGAGAALPFATAPVNTLDLVNIPQQLQ